MADIGDSSKEAMDDNLIQIIKQVQRLEEVKAETTGYIKDAFADAKAQGYDVKIIRELLKLMKRSIDDIAEENTTLAMYARAVKFELPDMNGE